MIGPKQNYNLRINSNKLILDSVVYIKKKKSLEILSIFCLKWPFLKIAQSFNFFFSIFVDRLSDSSVYDFVFDRLRSVRQDLVVQQGDFRMLQDPAVVQVLEICIKFHLLAGTLVIL
jgi:hypothetical protein